MQSCAYILRGFLYMENWNPVSITGKKYCYTQDIKQYWKYHEKLIDILSKTYNIFIYFITYDITPKSYIEWAQKLGSIILIPYYQSSQFTTLYQGLTQIDNYDCYMIHRTDIKYYDDFYDLFDNINMESKVYVLNKEITDLPSDLFFWFSSNKRLLFEKAISSYTINAHHIHTIIDINYLSKHKVLKVRSKNNLYELPYLNQNKIVLYTIPTSGINCLSNIITLCINKNAKIENASMYIPHLIKDTHIDIYSTHPKHIPYHTFDSNHKCIIMIRNPIDIAICRYFLHHTIKLNDIRESIYHYIIQNLPTIIEEIRYMISFYESNQNNHILLRYEDIYNSFEKTTNNIIQFMKKHSDLILHNKIDIQTIRNKTGFKNIQRRIVHRSMKINIMNDCLKTVQIVEVLKKIPNFIFDLFPELNVKQHSYEKLLISTPNPLYQLNKQSHKNKIKRASNMKWL